MGRCGSSRTPCLDSHQGQPPDLHFIPPEGYGTGGQGGNAGPWSFGNETLFRDCVTLKRTTCFRRKRPGCFLTDQYRLGTRRVRGSLELLGSRMGKWDPRVSRVGPAASDSDSAGVPQTRTDIIYCPRVFHSLSNDQLGRALEVTGAMTNLKIPQPDAPLRMK